VTGFAALHRPGSPLLLPNAWDFTSAAALAGQGFPAVGTTSLGVTAAAGLADGTGVARDETVALMRRLQPLRCFVTVDIEGGFSSVPTEVAGLCAELAALGAAGVNLEDGRADRSLAPITVQQELIRAVKQAAPALFLNARTDTHWLRSPTDLRDTQDRLRAYADAGADGVFVPGPLSDNDISALAGTTDRPLNVLYQPGRQSLARLGELGVARVSTGSLLFRAALAATVRAARAVADGIPLPDDLPTYSEIVDLVEHSRA
jgi:2-methylisocitrate lyase-like PEP mutase family enzyme